MLSRSQYVTPGEIHILLVAFPVIAWNCCDIPFILHSLEPVFILRQHAVCLSQSVSYETQPAGGSKTLSLAVDGRIHREALKALGPGATLQHCVQQKGQCW